MPRLDLTRDEIGLIISTLKIMSNETFLSSVPELTDDLEALVTKIFDQLGDES